MAELEKKQKEEIYERYFPKPDANKRAQESTIQRERRNCCSGPSHRVLSCCRNQHQNVTDTSNDTALGNSLKDAIKAIEGLAKDVGHLKYKMEILSDLSIPQMLRDYLQKQNHAMPPTDNIAGPSPTEVLSQAGDNHPTAAAQQYQDLLNASKTTIDDAVHDTSCELN